MEDGLHPDMTEEIRALMNRDHVAAAARIQQYLDQSNIILKIAITGETGSGKSSFTNVFRGIRNNDPGAAPVGACRPLTNDITQYLHPNYPNVMLSDLPGVGEMKWPAASYLKNTGFETFDFFIIISDTHFRENDAELMKEIKKMGKRFYFVRSKIDHTLGNEEINDMNFNSERTLALTRERCIQGILEQGFRDPQVFLLSSFHPQLYDFPLLHRTFTRDLFDLKKHALLCTIAAIHLEVINRKKMAYKANIMYYGATSAFGAFVPLPGISVAFDIGMVAKAVKEYLTGFGLDHSTLHRLAASTGVPYEDLTFTIGSVLAKDEITGDVILKLLTQLGSTSLLLATEEWTRFIPILGMPIAAGLSFTATHRALNFFLDELANEANRVYRRALGLIMA